MRFVGLLVVSVLVGSAGAAVAEKTPFLTLASTTSTRDSGLFAAILPEFQAATGVAVRVVAVDGMTLAVRPLDNITSDTEGEIV